MKYTFRLITCIAISSISFLGEMVKADSKPSLDSISFTGRWDLRDPGRAITVNGGSYFQAQFSGTAVSAEFDLSLNKSPLPTITWQIDGGDWQECEVAPKVKLADSLPEGTHSVWFMVRGIDEHQNRWTQPLVGSVTFLGLDMSQQGKMLPPLASWTNPKLKIEFLGDSITEGVLVQAGGRGEGKTSWPWQTDALHSYSCRTAMLLNAAWRQVGFGATGLTGGGNGGAPSAFDSFNYFYAGCPRDNWQPDLVVINEGTNDSVAPEQYAPLYGKYLALLRQGYPKAKIVALRPFCGNQEAGIKQAVDKARANGDNAIYYIDTTGWYSGPSPHPNADASAVIADKLTAALNTQVLNR